MLVDRPESPTSPLVPSGEFTVDAMNRARRLALPSALVAWNLSLHSPSPDLDAVEMLLTSRYSYWDADAPYDGQLLPPIE